MRIYYIAHARIPTQKAHGLTIVKSCESFAAAGADVVLLVPRRKNLYNRDLFDVYNVSRTFNVRYLFVLDLLRRYSGRFAFSIQLLTFYASVFFFMLFRSRKNALVYTRETHVLLLSLLGFRVVYECHHVFDSRPGFFSRCRRAYRIITISHALKNIFIRNGFDEKNIIVAPSGVDLDTFAITISKADARRELNLPSDKPIVLYTGNFTTMGEDKGIADIIAALRNVPEVLFAAVGGNEPDQERYRALAQKHGVGDRVIFFGNSPQTKLALFQRAADVLLMPFPDMPHYRNHMSPVKMFEYMASGRPIIASDLPTIREVLNDKNAVIVPPGDPKALAGAIRRLLSDTTRAQKLAAQAFSNVAVYTWKNRTQRILDAISKPL
jgi:glycosyltransferase involved in cell wall biosynthesis